MVFFLFMCKALTTETFIVFNEWVNLMLKQINKESLRKDMFLVEKIRGSEEQIKNGRVVKADTKMGDEEIDDLLKTNL